MSRSRIVKINAGGPLNRVQVLCRSCVVGGVLRVACESSSLRKDLSRTQSKEAAKHTNLETANFAFAVPNDTVRPHKKDFSHYVDV